MRDLCSAEGVVDLETCFERVVDVVGDDTGEKDGIVDGVGGGFVTRKHLFQSVLGTQRRRKMGRGTHSMSCIT